MGRSDVNDLPARTGPQGFSQLQADHDEAMENFALYIQREAVWSFVKHQHAEKQIHNNEEHPLWTVGIGDSGSWYAGTDRACCAARSGQARFVFWSGDVFLHRPRGLRMGECCLRVLASWGGSVVDGQWNNDGDPIVALNGGQYQDTGGNCVSHP